MKKRASPDSMPHSTQILAEYITKTGQKKQLNVFLLEKREVFLHFRVSNPIQGKAMKRFLLTLFFLSTLFTTPAIAAEAEELGPVMVVRYLDNQTSYERLLKKVIFSAQDIKSDAEFEIITVVAGTDGHADSRDSEKNMQIHTEEFKQAMEAYGVKPEKIRIKKSYNGLLYQGEIQLFVR